MKEKAMRMRMVRWMAVLAVGGLLPAGLMVLAQETGGAAGAGAAAKRKAGNDVTATPITLHYTDAAAEDVFKDLFGQLGFPYKVNDVRGNTGSWPAVTINADAQPFWQVVNTLNDTLHWSIMEPRNGTVNVNRRPDTGMDVENGMRCVSGPCLFIVRGAHHDIRFIDADEPRDCAVDMLMLVEPHIHLSTYSTRVAPDAAADENGNSLLFEKPPEMRMEKPRAQTYMEFQVVLNPPANAGKKIATLKGNAHIKVMDEATVVEIAAADFDSPAATEVNGLHAEISKITRSPSVGVTDYHVSLNVERAGADDEAWGKANDLMDGIEASIVDEAGVAYMPSGGGGGGSRASKNRIVSFTLRAEINPFATPKETAGPPAKCVITIPKVVRDVGVGYEFKNIMLP